MTRVLGDPRKLADSVSEEVLNQVKEKLEEAYEATIKLLEDGFRSKLEEAKNVVSEEYSKAMEEIKSVEAGKQSEVRMAVSKRKAEWTNKVLNEVRKRISELSPREKKEIMRNLLRALCAHELPWSKIVIECRKEDSEIIKSLLEEEEFKKRLEGIEVVVKGELESELGGLKAYPEDRRIVFDYTLDQMFENLKPTLLSVASKTLFEEG